MRRLAPALVFLGLASGLGQGLPVAAATASLPPDLCPRTTHATHPNIEYSTFVRRPGGQAVPLLLDEYDPRVPPGTPEPAVVLIHGGGWTSGCRRLLDPEAARLAAAGYLVFSIDYRLACGPDDHGYSRGVRALCGWTVRTPDPATGRRSAATTDILDALGWVRATASTFWSWNGKVAAIGESAGGHLLLVAIAQAPRGTEPDVAATWSAKVEMGRFVHPPADGWTSADTCDHSRVPHQCWPAVDAYLGADGCGRPLNPFVTDPSADAPVWGGTSPLSEWARRSRAELVPLFFSNGGGPDDTIYRKAETVPLREANEFARLLPAIGYATSDFQECIVDAPLHSLRYLFGHRCEGSPPGEPVFESTLRFLGPWTDVRPAV